MEHYQQRVESWPWPQNNCNNNEIVKKHFMSAVFAGKIQILFAIIKILPFHKIFFMRTIILTVLLGSIFSFVSCNNSGTTASGDKDSMNKTTAEKSVDLDKARA